MSVRSSQLPITRPAPKAPECPGCGTPRKAKYSTIDAEGKSSWQTAVARVWSGWTGYGHFCTQRCATAYANLVFEEKGLRYRVK